MQHTHFLCPVKGLNGGDWAGREEPAERQEKMCPLGLIYEELPAKVITFPAACVAGLLA